MITLTRKVLLTLVLTIFATATAGAETLTLRQALVLGMGHNFDLQIVGLDVERADAGVTGALGRFDVTAELAVDSGYSEFPADSTQIATDSFTSERTGVEAALSKQFATGLQTRLSLSGERSDTDSLANRLDPSYRSTLVLDLTQPLLKDFGDDVNTADLQIARIRHRQAAYGYLAEAQQLAVEIEQAYLDLAQAEAAVSFALLARDLARELLDGNQRKLAAGLIPVTEVTEARTAMAAREESRLLARQQVVLARNRLLDLIDHGDTPLPEGWQASFPDEREASVPALDLALATGLEQRPDLRQARLELEARKIALVYADNQRLPRLDLETSLGLNGLSGKGNENSTFQGPWQDSLGGAFDGDGSSWYAGLRLSMPLQNRVAKAGYREALAQDRQALYRLRRTEVTATTEIRSAHATLELGRERLEVARLSAELAQATLDQENRRLQEGLSDTFRVLIIQSSLVEAKTREAAALADYQRALAGLFRAMGTNLDRYDIVTALPQQGVLP